MADQFGTGKLKVPLNFFFIDSVPAVCKQCLESTVKKGLEPKPKDTGLTLKWKHNYYLDHNINQSYKNLNNEKRQGWKKVNKQDGMPM